MRIAIVGSGIAGLTAAYRLHREHDVTVFEAGEHVGGHTLTRDVERGGRTWPVDMGFIVFNDWTYPRFAALMEELQVPTQPSSMSFSVSCPTTGLEYNGTTVNSLFAQRRNFANARFLRMIADILRFNLHGARIAAVEHATLGEFLQRHRYSRAFMDYYLLPMGRAIWSATEEAILNCPVGFFVDFFRRHGFLSIDRRPQWRTIRGGSREYVRRLTAGFRSHIRTSTPVQGIRRAAEHVLIRSTRGDVERFDQVVLACHSDQALQLLEQPTPEEREILGAFPYQANEVVLHTDTRMLPRAPLARAAWNYHRLPVDARGDDPCVAVTYDMNILQRLTAPEVFMVTLNRTADIDPQRVIHAARFDHPVYTPDAVAAQRRRLEISGRNRTYFCGAYWRNGFHEDGCISGEWVAEQLAQLAGQQRGERRPAPLVDVVA